MIGSFSRLLVSFFCENSFFAFFSSGENVTEFFRRVAAITFEQAILGELESRGTRLTSPQIGTGGVLSKYSFSLYFLRNVWWHRWYQRRQNITLGYLSQLFRWYNVSDTFDNCEWHKWVWRKQRPWKSHFVVKAVNRIISSFCFAACGKKFTKVRVARAAQVFFPVQLQANGIMVLWPPSQSTVPNYLQCYRLDFFVWFIGDCVIDFLVILSCTQPRQVHHRTRKSEKKVYFPSCFVCLIFFPHLLKLQKLSTTSFVAYGNAAPQTNPLFSSENTSKKIQNELCIARRSACLSKTLPTMATFSSNGTPPHLTRDFNLNCRNWEENERRRRKSEKVEVLYWRARPVGIRQLKQARRRQKRERHLKM